MSDLFYSVVQGIANAWDYTIVKIFVIMAIAVIIAAVGVAIKRAASWKRKAKLTGATPEATKKEKRKDKEVIPPKFGWVLAFQVFGFIVLVPTFVSLLLVVFGGWHWFILVPVLLASTVVGLAVAILLGTTIVVNQGEEGVVNRLVQPRHYIFGIFRRQAIPTGTAGAIGGSLLAQTEGDPSVQRRSYGPGWHVVWPWDQVVGCRTAIVGANEIMKVWRPVGQDLPPGDIYGEQIDLTNISTVFDRRKGNSGWQPQVFRAGQVPDLPAQLIKVTASGIYGPTHLYPGFKFENEDGSQNFAAMGTSRERFLAIDVVDLLVDEPKSDAGGNIVKDTAGNVVMRKVTKHRGLQVRARQGKPLLPGVAAYSILDYGTNWTRLEAAIKSKDSAQIIKAALNPEEVPDLQDYSNWKGALYKGEIDRLLPPGTYWLDPFAFEGTVVDVPFVGADEVAAVNALIGRLPDKVNPVFGTVQTGYLGTWDDEVPSGTPLYLNPSAYEVIITKRSSITLTAHTKKSTAGFLDADMEQVLVDTSDGWTEVPLEVAVQFQLRRGAWPKLWKRFGSLKQVADLLYRKLTTACEVVSSTHPVMFLVANRDYVASEVNEALTKQDYKPIREKLDDTSLSKERLRVTKEVEKRYKLYQRGTAYFDLHPDLVEVQDVMKLNATPPRELMEIEEEASKQESLTRMYVVKGKAENSRRVAEEATANADMQREVTTSELRITVNDQNAAAALQTGAGIALLKEQVPGEGSEVLSRAMQQAAGASLLKDTLGAGNATAIIITEEAAKSKHHLGPNVLMNMPAGDGSSNISNAVAAMVVPQLAQQMNTGDDDGKKSSERPTKITSRGKVKATPEPKEPTATPSEPPKAPEPPKATK